MNNKTVFLAVFFVIFILVAIVFPIPAPLLDVLLTFSIAYALTMLILAILVKEPLEFSVFPTALLLGTLLRLSLNIAAARRILLYGHQGPDAAGHLIQSFGEFVVGGSLIVGVLIFLIFIIINFVVITRGAERISEVIARFTLDALPGKQMAIDADLNAGFITEEEAKKRREQLQREADFYGSLDGASKFIKGDVIAALLILILSILGGLAIGVFQHGMPISEALHTYTILSIGEGLVSQIPSLLLSTATAILVTKVASRDEVGRAFLEEIKRYPDALLYSAGLLFAFALVPGFPKVPFLILSAILATAYYFAKREIERETLRQIEDYLKKEKEKQQEKQQEEEKPEEYIPQPDPVTLEIGYSLISLFDEKQGGQAAQKIRKLRRKLAEDYGVIIHPIHIRDNLELKPNEYRILIKGVEEDRFVLYPDMYLAIDTGMAKAPPPGGIETYDPAFKIKAYWIPFTSREKAQQMGYMVVDPETVLVTHLSEVIKKNLWRIISRNEILQLIEALKKKYPKVVEDIVPNQVPISVIHRVVQNLLREGIPVKDMLTILETLADYYPAEKNIDNLTEHVRRALAPLISKLYAVNGNIYAAVLHPMLESELLGYVEQNRQSDFMKVVAEVVKPQLERLMEQFSKLGAQPVLVTAPEIRPYMKKVLENYLPQYSVLSYAELDKKVNLKVVGVVEKR
ncbi:MAG: flagellar biosynthesis protein FlhA [Aquificae bacterium]|jgi:flagellar biosynthesis protein FlhA|nr:flagellar biosynthesis protein FlhA [Aquificota bacterium]